MAFYSFFARFSRIIVILTLISSEVTARDGQPTDSLKVVSDQLPDDTTKVNSLIRQADEYFWSGAYDKALSTSTAAYELGKKLSFMSGAGSAVVTAGQCNIRMGKYNEASELFSEAIRIFSELEQPIEVANSHLYLGQAYDFKAEYNNALTEYRIAHEIAAQTGDSLVLAKILNSAGITNFNKGNYEGALEHYLSALKITPTKGNEKVYATIANNVGVVHVQLKQYEDALKYFLLYVDHMKRLKGTHGLGVGYLNIGETYKKLGQYDKAITYLTEASVIQSQTGDKKGLALSYSNMGDVHKAQHDWKNATGYYVLSIDIAREIKNDEVLLNPLTGIAEMYVVTGTFGKAQQTIHEARHVASKIGSMPWLERAYLISSKLDSARGDFRGAYAWFKKYASLSDSLFSEEQAKQIFRMKELYESERKDKEIRLLSESNKLAEIQRANSRTLFTVSVSFLSLVILIILYWLVQKTRHSRILKKQKDELSEAHREQKQLVERIEAQKQELSQKNEDLHRLHREKDGLIGVVAHDLRSPLNRILGLSHLIPMAGNLNSEQQTMLQTIKKVCEDGTHLITDLLELNEYEVTQNVVLERANLTVLVRDHLAQFADQLAKKEIALYFDSTSPADVFVETHTHYVKRILDNLVSNAIKFSPKGKRIWVTLDTTDNLATDVIIRDEGPGFSKDDLLHLFQKFKKLSARPTAGENSTGLGLSIVKLLTDKIGGSITVESNEGQGAVFYVTLPVSQSAAVEVADADAVVLR